MFHIDFENDVVQCQILSYPGISLPNALDISHLLVNSLVLFTCRL